MLKKITLFLLILLVWSANALAATGAQMKSGFITLSEGRKIFYRHFPSTAKGPEKSTLLLVNGLIYDLENWDEFIDRAQELGHPVISFAFSAQPESLRGLEGKEPDFFLKGLEPQDLSDEILAVYKKLKRTGKVDLVTLSYGSIGAVFASQHRDKVDHLIMMAPLVVPVDQYDPNGKLLHFWFDGFRKASAMWDPWGLWTPYWYEYAYRVIYGSYMENRMETNGKNDPDYYPEGVEPTVYKKAVFHLARAARDFDLKEMVTHALPETHIVIASEDDRPLIQDQLAVWENLPKANRGSFTLMNPAYHGIPGAHPRQGMDMVAVILGDSRIRVGGGKSYLYTLKRGENLREVEFDDIKKAFNQ